MASNARSNAIHQHQGMALALPRVEDRSGQCRFVGVGKHLVIRTALNTMHKSCCFDSKVDRRQPKQFLPACPAITPIAMPFEDRLQG